MKREKLDILFKGVIISVITVFVVSKFMSATNVINDVYAQQSEESYINIQNIGSVQNTENFNAKIENGVQIVEFDLQNYGYPNIDLQSNLPVKLIINADENSLSSCNYRIICQDLGLQYEFSSGENVIEFTPTESGKYIYSCWMGMIGANINVVDEDITPNVYYGENISQSGCCS